MNLIQKEFYYNENEILSYFNEIELLENNSINIESGWSLEEKEYYDSIIFTSYENYKVTDEYYIKLRRNREFIKNSFTIRKFLIGDVLEFAYFYKNAALTFSGICIAIKKKSFILPDLSLILRNIIIKTGMEITYSYFYNRAYKQKFLDYKRKIFTYNKNKLYFIRDRLNRESRVI